MTLISYRDDMALFCMNMCQIAMELASHRTGWTGVSAHLIQMFDHMDAANLLEDTKHAIVLQQAAKLDIPIRTEAGKMMIGVPRVERCIALYLRLAGLHV